MSPFVSTSDPAGFGIAQGLDIPGIAFEASCLGSERWPSGICGELEPSQRCLSPMRPSFARMTQGRCLQPLFAYTKLRKTLSLPLRGKNSGSIKKRDDLEPSIPDIEILWAPAAVWGPALVDPPEGSLGVTMVMKLPRALLSSFDALFSLRSTCTPRARGTSRLLRRIHGQVRLSSPSERFDRNEQHKSSSFIHSYFALEDDLDVVVRGVRFSQRLARTEPLASMLDLRTDPGDREGNIFWLGDLDPDTVDCSCYPTLTLS